MQKFSTKIFDEIENERTNLKEQMRLNTLKKVIEELTRYFANTEIVKIYLTGSILKAGRFRNNSDVDIAMLGLPSQLHFKIIFELEEILYRRVEIIELEKCAFAAQIIDTGLKIK